MGVVVVVVCVLLCIEIRFEMMCPIEEASFCVCCNLSVFKGLSSFSSFSSARFNFTFNFSSISSFNGFIFFFCGFWVISCGSLFLVLTCCCSCTECGISSFEGVFFLFFCSFWVLGFWVISAGSLFLLTCCFSCTECGRPLAAKCIEVARLQTFESCWDVEEEEVEEEEGLENLEEDEEDL